jgi:hypothetical protein
LVSSSSFWPYCLSSDCVELEEQMPVSTPAETVARQTLVTPTTGLTKSTYVEWRAIIAGAVGATAISFVLLTFGSAIGLSVVSPWSHAGMSLTWFAVLTGLFMVLVHVGSLAAGGYIAGRMRAPWAGDFAPEGHFRDGAHGFLVWALTVIVGAWLVATTAAEGLKTGVQATAAVGAGAASGLAIRDRSTGEQGPQNYGVDYLLRPGPNATNEMPALDPSSRQELGRIFATGLQKETLDPRERSYLAQIVVRRTGLPEAEAEKRVDDAFMEAKAAEVRIREAADKARKAAAVAAFLTAATLLIGCAAAAAGAGLGGRHRDERTAARFWGSSRFW